MTRRIVLFFLMAAMFVPAFGQRNKKGKEAKPAATEKIVTAAKDHHFEVAKNLEVFNTIYRNLDMIYVDSLDAAETIGAGIDAMLGSLDPYTEYYPEERLQELKSIFTGNIYAGIGSTIHYNPVIKRVCIYEPYEGNPAHEAGLRMGDIILSVDDESMIDKDVSYVSSHLRGEAGTSFLLKIKRPSTGKTMQMKITRRQIQNPTIPYYGLQPDSIGYILLSGFTENSAREVRRAFIDLKKQGMRRLVLDLRGNGGGSEAEAVQIVNMFVPKGINVVSNRGKLKKVSRDYMTTVEPLDSVMPLVVLVNGNSASASEITSGALQDLDRAVILGTRTYGKGLVQMTVDLPYNGSLKLTSNKYYIPSGRCIQAINYKKKREERGEKDRGERREERGESGYTEHVPDSLAKVFYTRNGREVRDGGGIKPDVEVKPDSLPNIAYYLQVSGRDSADVLYNYELDYYLSHPSIAKPRDFQLTDAEYEQFKQRVVKSGFTYDPESAKILKNLKRMAEFEGYYDDAKQEFENLEKKLQHNLDKDLDKHKAVIKQMLESDIVASYYYQRGSAELSLRYDKQFLEACRLLKSPDEYAKILQPAQP